MKNFLYFLLGFFLVTAILVPSAYPAYPGLCHRTFYSLQNCSSTTVTSWFAPGINGFNQYGAPLASTLYQSTGDYCYVTVRNFYWDSELSTQWSYAGQYVYNMRPADWQTLEYEYDAVQIPIEKNNVTALLQDYPGCSSECPDSDSDGTCDECDPFPNDSTMNGKHYAKGYYEYNGEIVAALTSSSESNDSYDYVTVFNRSFPGAIIGHGGIDEQTFIQSGGKFVVLNNPALLYEAKCPAVQSTDECEELTCEYSQGETGSDLGIQSEGEDLEAQSVEDDAEYLYPDKTCEEYKTLCAKSCGGHNAVSNFDCTEGGNMNCQCNTGGEYTYLDHYGDSAEPDPSSISPSTGDIIQGGSSSGSDIIDGDTGLDGGPEDSDSDGYIDSYGGFGDRVVNYNPLLAAVSGIENKFPFSLVTTARDLVNNFNSSGSCPQFTLHLLSNDLVFDLCFLDPIATTIRVLFMFVLTASAFWCILRFFM